MLRRIPALLTGQARKVSGRTNTNFKKALQSIRAGDRVFAAVLFNVSDDDVHTLFFQSMTFFKHPIGLAGAGSVTEPSPAKVPFFAFDLFQELFGCGATGFAHSYNYTIYLLMLQCY